jgi:hypothetical protein
MHNDGHCTSMMMTPRAEQKANFEVDVKLTLLRLSTPDSFKLLASSPFPAWRLTPRQF